MRINVFLFLFAITASLYACTNSGTDNKSAKKQALSAMDIDARLKEADSLVVVFYNDPYGEDSLRYTRYYKQLSVIEKWGIEKLQQQLSGQFAKQEKRNGCRGEGKIWCFTKGKIFQTLYFSTRCEDCCYLYLIKDGNFYYTRTSESFIEWLSTVKPTAQAPPDGAPETSNK